MDPVVLIPLSAGAAIIGFSCVVFAVALRRAHRYPVSQVPEIEESRIAVHAEWRKVLVQVLVLIAVIAAFREAHAPAFGDGIVPTLASALALALAPQGANQAYKETETARVKAVQKLCATWPPLEVNEKMWPHLW